MKDTNIYKKSWHYVLILFKIALCWYLPLIYTEHVVMWGCANVYLLSSIFISTSMLNSKCVADYNANLVMSTDQNSGMRPGRWHGCEPSVCLAKIAPSGCYPGRPSKLAKHQWWIRKLFRRCWLVLSLLLKVRCKALPARSTTKMPLEQVGQWSW